MASRPTNSPATRATAGSRMGQRARRARVVIAWVLLAGSVIGWPLSALTLAKNEPQFVLGLSWLAIVLSSAELLTASQVHEEQGDKNGKG